jgi:hypothetical protein
MKLFGLGAVVVVTAFVAGLPQAGGAAESHEYEIAANDGYGLEDCLSTGGECGRVVADAWCEAHGHGHALSFGLRSAVDERPTRVSATEESYVVRCGD